MRNALTLIEVLLTMALAVVLMGLVSGAMRLYAREMNVRDLEIRRTHLATQLLDMIENDLMAALHPDPIETAALEEFLLSAVSADASMEELAGGEDLSSAGLDDTFDDDAVATETTDSALTAGIVLEEPGMIGTANVIQFDISRLPRLEEYVPIIDGDMAEIDDVPSDLKTVAYLVQPPGFVGGVKDDFREMLNSLRPGGGSEGGGGLVRRSLDRAATVSAASTGRLDALNATGQVIAPEVTAIEFRYWDGSIWNVQWDSDALGELPIAVEITLSLVSPEAAELMASESGKAPDDLSIRTFKRVMRLPMAKFMEEQTMAGDDGSTGGDSSASGSSGASSSGGDTP